MTDKQYWIERWQQQQTGFHRDDVHPALAKWHSTVMSAGGDVFVPLCGKSMDMRWLVSRGHKVIGVEVSEIAVLSFIQEHSLNAIAGKCRQIPVWRSEDTLIFCGDFFDIEPADVASAAYVYDRAALVALDGTLRQQYANHLIKILPAGASILLVTLDYDQQEMAGPPFAVADSEVHLLFDGQFEISLLDEADVLDEHERFREKGLRRLIERTYHLQPKGRTS